MTVTIEGVGATRGIVEWMDPLHHRPIFFGSGTGRGHTAVAAGRRPHRRADEGCRLLEVAQGAELIQEFGSPLYLIVFNTPTPC